MRTSEPRPAWRRVLAAGAAAALAGVLSCTAASCTAARTAVRWQAGGSGDTRSPAGTVHRYDHVVIVMEENKDRDQIIGSGDAPYITSLAAGGANLTDFHAETHPSQPNYLAMFSGGTQGITDDHCPYDLAADNLGDQLRTHGYTFTGYAEDLPADGSTACGDDGDSGFARKHDPWVDFTDLPASSNVRYQEFPAEFGRLPTVAWVTPNLCDDMHDCGVSTGDAWLRAHLSRYVTWARAHNSLLILTWDEDDGGDAGNRIATVLAGADIRPGDYGEHATHYSLLRTLEDMYGLPPLGHAADASAITDVFTR